MNAKRAFDGLTLVAIGGILLANTLGGLPWAVWITIISLWPIALVVGRHRHHRQEHDAGRGCASLASLITMAALLYGAFVMTPGHVGLPGAASHRRAARRPSPLSKRTAGDVDRAGTPTSTSGATRPVPLEPGYDLAALSGGRRAGLAVPEGTVSGRRRRTCASIGMHRERLVGDILRAARGRTCRLTLDRDDRLATRSSVNAGPHGVDIDLTGMSVERVRRPTSARLADVIVPAGSHTGGR